MPAIRGITVAVGEPYARTLDICLARNMRHFVEAWVITAPTDSAVKAVASKVPGVRVFETNGFYEHGAAFNKGLCIEQCFDAMGKRGWLCVIDSDILLPDDLPLGNLDPECIHGARRRILADPAKWSPGLDWKTCPPHPDGRAPIGFLQLVHSDAKALRDRPWWYDPSFAHSGGGDAAFLAWWPREKWRMLGCDCLHLGEPDRNWFGVDPKHKDMMARFVTENGWRRAAARVTPEQVARAEAPVHRVQVPGYPPSSFELPFVERARALRPRA